MSACGRVGMGSWDNLLRGEQLHFRFWWLESSKITCREVEPSLSTLKGILQVLQSFLPVPCALQQEGEGSLYFQSAMPLLSSYPQPFECTLKQSTSGEGRILQGRGNSGFIGGIQSAGSCSWMMRPEG